MLTLISEYYTVGCKGISSLGGERESTLRCTMYCAGCSMARTLMKDDRWLKQDWGSSAEIVRRHEVE